MIFPLNESEGSSAAGRRLMPMYSGIREDFPQPFPCPGTEARGRAKRLLTALSPLSAHPHGLMVDGSEVARGSAPRGPLFTRPLNAAREWLRRAAPCVSTDSAGALIFSQNPVSVGFTTCQRSHLLLIAGTHLRISEGKKEMKVTLSQFLSFYFFIFIIFFQRNQVLKVSRDK